MLCPSLRRVIISWGEKLWAQKSFYKHSRCLASRPTSTMLSGEVWLVLGRIRSVWSVILSGWQQMSGFLINQTKVVRCGLSSLVWLINLFGWTVLNDFSGILCSFLEYVTSIPWWQETGGNPNLWGLVSRGEQHNNPYDSNLLHLSEVMHYVAPPKIKSTDDFASRIEARSARGANAPIGQVSIEIKTASDCDIIIKFAVAGHHFGEGTGTEAWWGDLLH